MRMEVKRKSIEIHCENEQDIAYFKGTLGLGFKEDGNTVELEAKAEMKYDDWTEHSHPELGVLVISRKD